MLVEFVLPMLFAAFLCWLVLHLWTRGERDERWFDPPHSHSEEPLQRVPRIFTQPHTLPRTTGSAGSVSTTATADTPSAVRTSSTATTDPTREADSGLRSSTFRPAENPAAATSEAWSSEASPDTASPEKAAVASAGLDGDSITDAQAALRRATLSSRGVHEDALSTTTLDPDPGNPSERQHTQYDHARSSDVQPGDVQPSEVQSSDAQSSDTESQDAERAIESSEDLGEDRQSAAQSPARDDSQMRKQRHQSKSRSRSPKTDTIGDDLQRIKGIGPVIEKQLKEHGITTFEQLAAFGPSEIESLSTEISFKGRIEREDWVGQAKGFMAENHEAG